MPAEIDLVQTLIMKHAAATGSTYAQRLLSDWASLQQKLVKVMPREYKRALAQQAQRGGHRGRGRGGAWWRPGHAARAAHG